MNKSDIKPIIRYLVKKNMLTFEIIEELGTTLGPKTPSKSTIKKWVKFFKKRREIKEQYKKLETRSKARFKARIDKIFLMILNDNSLTCREIASSMNMVEERVSTILETILHRKKYCSRWVPSELSREQRITRVLYAQKHLELFDKDPKGFLKRFVTSDQFWIPCKSKTRGKHPQEGETRQSRTSMSITTIKMLVSVFWDAEGIILIEYHDQAITDEIYVTSLNKLFEQLCEKRPNIGKNIILHQSNAQLQKSPICIAKAFELGFELSDHPAYSPDLAPSDYYLFPTLRANLKGLPLASKDKVIMYVEKFVRELHEDAVKNAFVNLKHRWKKCIECRGDYIGAYLTCDASKEPSETEEYEESGESDDSEESDETEESEECDGSGEREESGECEGSVEIEESEECKGSED